MCCMPPFGTVKHKIFPVFKPNQFFWNNYWKEIQNVDEKKSKCEVYAKTIHKIMVENSHLKPSDIKADDRWEYLKEYRGVDHIEEE